METNLGFKCGIGRSSQQLIRHLVCYERRIQVEGTPELMVRSI